MCRSDGTWSWAPQSVRAQRGTEQCFLGCGQRNEPGCAFSWGRAQPLDSGRLLVWCCSHKDHSGSLRSLRRQEKSHWRWISGKNGAELSVVYHRAL